MSRARRGVADDLVIMCQAPGAGDDRVFLEMGTMKHLLIS